MSVEKRVKMLIGECQLTIIILQIQLEEANKRIVELEAEKDKKQE